jgi:hypothetical protein
LITSQLLGKGGGIYLNYPFNPENPRSDRDFFEGYRREVIYSSERVPVITLTPELIRDGLDNLAIGQVLVGYGVNDNFIEPNYLAMIIREPQECVNSAIYWKVIAKFNLRELEWCIRPNDLVRS